MRKIVILLFINLFLSIQANAFEVFNSTPKAQIKAMIRKCDKALSNQDIEKVKTFYDESYKSTDGFNLEEVIQMLEKTYKAYGNIKYKSKIASINAHNDWALVQISDNISAKIYPTEIKKIKKEKMGKLEGHSVYNLYLKKINNDWKIVADDVLIEETSLKYGIANKIDMDLIAPLQVKNNEEYDLSLKIEKPKDIVALASISKEEITYPPKDCDEKFRKFPEYGELERIVRANNKNIDEYAMASVGLTKVSVNEEQTRAKIEVIGIAHIMKRINIAQEKNNSEILVENK